MGRRIVTAIVRKLTGCALLSRAEAIAINNAAGFTVCAVRDYVASRYGVRITSADYDATGLPLAAQILLDTVNKQRKEIADSLVATMDGPFI